MFGIRILGAATAYCVILLEIYSGVIKGPEWWIYPGALVIALLMAISLFGFSGQKEGAERSASILAVILQWALILAAAFAMSYFANYFGREIIPGIIAV